MSSVRAKKDYFLLQERPEMAQPDVDAQAAIIRFYKNG